jgi:light-regulated signal transduction histidine kinase (bacteriophytochrome)
MIARADEGLLRIMLQNLLGNAWKFTKNRAGARVEFGRTEDGGRRVYFVRDNGAGFNMRGAPRLFNPFQRLHTRGEFEGTGIGLAIVKRVVSRHGGEVWAEGREGEGASVFFTLE